MRGASSRGVDAALDELGPPDTYARQFLGHDTTPALATPAAAPSAVPARAAATTLSDLAQLATRRWTSLPLLFAVVTAYAVAVLALVLALTKVLEPSALGLWIAERPGSAQPRFFFGITDRAQPGREVLGYWLIVPLLVLAAAIHLGVSRLLRRAVRRTEH